jgi:hypothetical protein
MNQFSVYIKAQWSLICFSLRPICKFIFLFSLCLSITFYFFAWTRRGIYWQTAQNTAERRDLEGNPVTAFYCTPCSLNSLEHSVQQEKFQVSSRQSSTIPPMSIPLHPHKCPSKGYIFHKVPTTVSCPGLLCPDSLSHTSLTMITGILSSS